MLHVVLMDTREDDGIDRAGFFTETAVDALEQVDVVTRGTARAIGRHVRIDGDAHGRAHGLAQLAGDATLFAVRITTQRMQSTESRRLWRLLFRVVDRELSREEFLPRDPQAAEQLPECECLDDVAHD